MNTFIQIFKQDYYPLNSAIELSLSDVAARDAITALQARAPLTALVHHLSSMALKISGIYNIYYNLTSSGHTTQALQDVKPLALLPVGLFGTVAALRKGDKRLAFTYFVSTVLPGVASVANAYWTLSLLSSDNVSVRRAGGPTEPYLLPGDRNYTGF